MRQDLLDKINNLSKSLAKVSIWKNSKDAFGHIVIYDSGKEKIAENNYIYEFYCYMKIIEDLDKNPNHLIKFISGNDIFPRNPASKKGRPYFILEVNGKQVFQICSGTKIQTKIPNKKKAPDISFQKIGSNDKLPNYNEILVIYDSKYSEGKNEKSFQESQMSDFNKMIRYLDLENAEDISLYFTDYKEFTGNCLLTNKKSYTDNLEELKEECITVVEYFDNGKSFTVIK